MIDGPGGPGQPAKPGTGITRKKDDAIEKPQEGIQGIEQLADAFASVCSRDLDQIVSSTQIRTALIQNGFPAGLANYLGQSFLDRIADARQSLAVAATKPKLKDALIETVKEETVEYFKSKEEEILRYFDVAQDPVGYLRTLENVLPSIDLSNFTIDQVNQFTSSIRRFQIDEIKLLTRIGQLIKTVLEEELKVTVRRVNEPQEYAARIGVRLIIKLDLGTKDPSQANAKLSEVSKLLGQRFTHITVSHSIVGNTSYSSNTDLEIWVD